MNDFGADAKSARKKIPFACLDRLSTLIVRAGKIHEEVEEKLKEILLPALPTLKNEIKKEEQYPGYYKSIDNQCDNLEVILDSFESIINRSDF